MRNNNVMYIVAIQLTLVDMGYDFSRYGTATLSSGVATMSSLAQLRLQDTEKQR